MDLDHAIFRKVACGLNAKQQEVYNFQHIANLLAKYGYAAYPIQQQRAFDVGFFLTGRRAT
jgi:hypothetical protein